MVTEEVVGAAAEAFAAEVGGGFADAAVDSGDAVVAAFGVADAAAGVTIRTIEDGEE